MRRKPLYRSLTYWSGILVMSFIAWAWRDSTRFVSEIRVGQRVAANVAGFLSIGSIVDVASWGGPEIQFRRERLERFKGRLITPLFPASLYAAGDAETGDPFWPPGKPPGTETFTYASYVDEGMTRHLQGEWILLIPHWQVSLAGALPWSLLLLWRARRKLAIASIYRKGTKGIARQTT